MRKPKPCGTFMKIMYEAEARSIAGVDKFATNDRLLHSSISDHLFCLERAGIF